MKAFHTIAIPHKDILEGRLTMDVFAADLSEVVKNRGPEEYRDKGTFFSKTYMTEGLQNLLDVVERRLKGNGGDPVIQIQTPFGGGKTHSLIAMYHRAADWKANRVVFTGTTESAEKVTIWGHLEKSLTGKNKEMTGKSAPGREAIRNLLVGHEPLLILMDEVLEYVAKAAAVKVEESSLAEQTIAFMQELTETVASLERVCLVVTLPASIGEHFNEKSEKLYKQLTKVSGRVEKIYAPVQDTEIARIIRQRLFSRVDQAKCKEFVSAFNQYADKESLFPADLFATDYRDRFESSYPFQPEVIDTLYHRWGSFQTFQRTRGVLRLLALVIHSQLKQNKPYISLADFDLDHQEIRQELLKHIGMTFNGVISSDITGKNSGAKQVDESLGGAYRGLNLGTRTATTIFMYSFSGGLERGATIEEIKRSATTLDNPAAAIGAAIEQFTGRLFYMRSLDKKYFFDKVVNIWQTMTTRMENISPAEVADLEKELLQKAISGSRMRVHIWEDNPTNVPDSGEPKLVILQRNDAVLMQAIQKNKGTAATRVNVNYVMFLAPNESERTAFSNLLKRKLALESMEQDKSLTMTDDDRKEIRHDQKRTEDGIQESMRRVYRTIYVPSAQGFKTLDIGTGTFGVGRSLDIEVYDRLRKDGDIMEKVAPLLIKEKFLVGKDYVLTEQLFQSMLRTPGSLRPYNRDALELGIKEGVSTGLFGLGELEDGEPRCRFYKEVSTVAFSDTEVIISEKVARELKKKELDPKAAEDSKREESNETDATEEPKGKDLPPRAKELSSLQLEFELPRGKVAGVMGILNLLQSKFEHLDLQIKVGGGSITQQDVEDKIEEALRQMGVKLK